ncbi:hypothetical protein [uncultured Cohaesibacter sp.]|uniref:hypothetical protein n=1 Tax=uncultured Cohaesibacter sp. TaxID=1002546 RepID=UPI0029C7A81B|nr:hypothetical protein [uncultured Cohaesibacter sp.]
MILSEAEQAKIRHRLSIGNSPKTIALNYAGLPGILQEIKDIRAGMDNQAHGRRVVMRPPAPLEDTFLAGKESWYQALSPDLRMLVKEVCHKHGVTLLELHSGQQGGPARQMLCHALRFRWAMPFPEIAKLFSVHPDTAKKLCMAWEGKSAVTNPPMPPMPKDVVPVALAVAGEHGVTCLALIKSAGLPGLHEAARSHFTYRLYAALGYTLEDIVRLFGCAPKTGRKQLLAHIKARNLDRAEAERKHKAAAKARYGRQPRAMIAAE